MDVSPQLSSYETDLAHRSLQHCIYKQMLFSVQALVGFRYPVESDINSSKICSDRRREVLPDPFFREFYKATIGIDFANKNFS
jgi:hypothetical protein